MLLFILHLFIGAMLTGPAVALALILGDGSLVQTGAAALIGFAAAFPVSLLVARRLGGR